MTPYDQKPPASPPSGEPASAPDAPPPKNWRSGSQKRQRRRCVAVWLTDAEYDAAETRARETGLSLSSYGRTLFLGVPGPRARRRPTIHAQALALATAALNKLGNNFNQIAHRLNAGAAFSLASEYAAALADVRRTLHVIREAAAGRSDNDNQGQPPQ